MNTTTYWHIAHPSYTGGDLQCRNNLGDAAPEWGWGEDAPEGFDGDVVCLFPDTAEGREEADALWFERPDHALLRIDLPADEDNYGDEIPLTVTRVEEGYPAVMNAIPARYITEVRRGYVTASVVGGN